MDGNIADWPSAPLRAAFRQHLAELQCLRPVGDRRDAGPPMSSASLPTAGGADPVIGANTFIYLNTDQNASTGYTPFAGTSLGADYVVESSRTPTAVSPYLYSATSSGISSTPLNGGALQLVASPANGFEIAIPQSLLTPSSRPTRRPRSTSPRYRTTSLGFPPFSPLSRNIRLATRGGHAGRSFSQEDRHRLLAGAATSGAVDANGVPIRKPTFKNKAYNDLFLTAQDQADAAGVPTTSSPRTNSRR